MKLDNPAAFYLLGVLWAKKGPALRWTAGAAQLICVLLAVPVASEKPSDLAVVIGS